MPARSIAKGTISLGMVSIPVKLYTATRAQSVSFNHLHAACGTRVKQQLICPAHEPPPVLTSSDLVKAFEYTRDQYVQFSAEEIKAIEADRPTVLELVEFVPADTVDFLYIEKTQYLGPDKGGDDGYHMLAHALERTSRIGVGTFANRGKDTLVLLRPYRGGLLLHEAFYANEVVPWAEVPLGNPKPMTPLMLGAAQLLVEKLERTAFDPERFTDRWAEKVTALVKKKVGGDTVVIEPDAPKATIIDLAEALKRSIDQLASQVSEHPERSTVQPKGPRKATPRSSPKRKRGHVEG